MHTVILVHNFKVNKLFLYKKSKEIMEFSKLRTLQE